MHILDEIDEVHAVDAYIESCFHDIPPLRDHRVRIDWIRRIRRATIAIATPAMKITIHSGSKYGRCCKYAINGFFASVPRRRPTTAANAATYVRMVVVRASLAAVAISKNS